MDFDEEVIVPRRFGRRVLMPAGLRRALRMVKRRYLGHCWAFRIRKFQDIYILKEIVCLRCRQAGYTDNVFMKDSSNRSILKACWMPFIGCAEATVYNIMLD